MSRRESRREARRDVGGDGERRGDNGSRGVRCSRKSVEWLSSSRLDVLGAKNPRN